KIILISKIGVVSLWFIPFIFLNSNFFRSFRNLLIIYYILVSYLTFSRNKISLLSIISYLFILSIAGLSALNFLIFDPVVINTVTKPIFLNNLLFSDSWILMLLLISSAIIIFCFFLKKIERK